MFGNVVRNWKNSVFFQSLKYWRISNKITKNCTNFLLPSHYTWWLLLEMCGRKIENDPVLHVSFMKVERFYSKKYSIQWKLIKQMSRELWENGNSCTIYKSKIALRIGIPLPLVEGYGAAEQDFSVQIHIIGVIDTRKRNH